MRGRKPKPTFLKLVAGNPSRRPLNDAEPQPTGDLMKPPEWLTESQREIWQTAIDSSPPGLLRSIDESVFCVWVIAKDMHRNAAEKIAQSGTLVRIPNSNYPMQSPWVPVLNRQALIMLKACSEMGFTPSSRSRVKVENTTRGKNRFAGLKDIGEVADD